VELGVVTVPSPIEDTPRIISSTRSSVFDFVKMDYLFLRSFTAHDPKFRFVVLSVVGAQQSGVTQHWEEHRVVDAPIPLKH
jgi:hypothetical protein